MKSNLTKLVLIGLPLLLMLVIGLCSQTNEKQEHARFQELNADSEQYYPGTAKDRYQIESETKSSPAIPKVNLDFLSTEVDKGAANNDAQNKVSEPSTIKLNAPLSLKSIADSDEDVAPAEDPIPLVAPTRLKNEQAENRDESDASPISTLDDRDDQSNENVDYELTSDEGDGPVSVLSGTSGMGVAEVEIETEIAETIDTIEERMEQTKFVPLSARTATASQQRWLGGRQRAGHRTLPPIPTDSPALPMAANATPVVLPAKQVVPEQIVTEQVVGEHMIIEEGPMTVLPPGITTQIRQRLDYGTSLAKRGAFASAEDIYLQVIRLIAETKDSQLGVRNHTNDLADGLTAFEEAKDFVSEDLRTRVRLNVASIVQTHSTTLLHEEDCETVTPIQALQRYYEFVSQKFVNACDQEPIASEALYYLGKLYSTSSQVDPAASALQNAKSMIMQQASMEIDSMNHKSSNELGVLLARYGRLDDAREMLIHSVSVRPTPITWENLSKVHAKLGEGRLAELAASETKIMLEQDSPGLKRRDAAINWVSPEQFAAQTGNVKQTFPAVTAQEQAAPAVRVAEKPAEGKGKAWWQVWKR